MEIFADIPEYWQRIDYALMQNGPMNLYYRNEILDSDIDSLKGLGYLIEIFDCSKWENNGLMYDAFAEQLKFPDYFGRNLAALNDCLCDLEMPEEGGRALVFKNYDQFAKIDGEIAQIVLDIIHSRSYSYLLTGHRLIGLVQSNDPSISFEVGSQGVQWNHREWLKSSRGL